MAKSWAKFNGYPETCNLNVLFCNPKLFQGSAKLRENLKPNQKPVEVKEETQDSIRQVKNVAGIVYSSPHKN